MKPVKQLQFTEPLRCKAIRMEGTGRQRFMHAVQRQRHNEGWFLESAPMGTRVTNKVLPTKVEDCAEGLQELRISSLRSRDQAVTDTRAGSEPKGASTQSARRAKSAVGREIVSTTSLEQKFEEDKIIFVEGTLPDGQTVYPQLDNGSDLSCILMEHVVALGLQSKLVLRKPARQYQVRGIGQATGTGQRLKYDIWLSILVKGRNVVDWELSELAPVGGHYGRLKVEGWFTVLEEE